MAVPYPPRVVPLFAVPFASATIPDADALNAELQPLLSARADDAHRDPAAARDPACFESRADLFHWREPPMARLRDALLAHVARVATELSGYDAEEAARLRVQARAWFGVVLPGGAVAARQYPMASWCVLYCVQATDAPPDRLEAGSLRLYDPRLGNVYLDAGNGRLKLPYGHGHFGARLVPGQALCFPAHLLHEIVPLPPDCTRPLVYVAATVRLVMAGDP